jgi:hypothetical protein
MRATSSRQRILPPDMKCRAVHWLWLLVFGAMLSGISGCTTNEPENASVRPWNTPQGWESGMPMMNQQQQR